MADAAGPADALPAQTAGPQSTTNAATLRRRRYGGSKKRAATPSPPPPTEAVTTDVNKLRQLFVKALSQFPYRISPTIKRRLLTAVDLLEDRPADIAPFLGGSEALDTRVIQEKPLIRERTVELFFQLLTVLAVCALAFAVGVTIGSIVCRTTLFSGSALVGLYVETQTSNSTSSSATANQPQVTLVLPRTNGWSKQPTVTAVLVGRFNVSLPEYSLGAYVEALSAVLTLTYLPAMHIGGNSNTCFPNQQSPVSAGSKAHSAAKTRRLHAGSGKGSKFQRPGVRVRALMASAQSATAHDGALMETTDADVDQTERSLSSTGTVDSDQRAAASNARPPHHSSSNKEDTASRRGNAKAFRASVSSRAVDKMRYAGGEALRRLGESEDSRESDSQSHKYSGSEGSSAPQVRRLSSQSLSPVQKRWRARMLTFMQRFLRSAAQAVPRQSGVDGNQSSQQPADNVDEKTLIRTAALAGPARPVRSFNTAEYALVRRAIESSSLLSHSSVATRQELRVPIYDPVTGTEKLESLMLVRHTSPPGFALDLLERAAKQQNELQPTLLFRSILPFVVGLARGLNKVQVTASINVPLIAENQELLNALQQDCALQRVYFSLEVTLQSVRAMFFKQTHGKRIFEPFHVYCSTEQLTDENAWPPPTPKSMVYDVAELAAEYASLSIGFGSTP